MVSVSTNPRQARRIERARVQANDYTVRPVEGPGEGVRWWVINNRTRKRYFVQYGTCDCIDFKKKGRRSDGSLTGLECKHILLAKQAMNFTDEPLEDTPTPAVVFETLSPREATLQEQDERRGPDFDARRAQAYEDRKLWD